ncbi:hypothetical protein SSS_00479 [Sarcoptes scabiei]|nr:hypothetical protein SSS_00479 [Sarcoptes scabiei]
MLNQFLRFNGNYVRCLAAYRSQSINQRLIYLTSIREGKNYDKAIKLNPIDTEYRFDDDRFLPGPFYANEPYIKPTDDEIVELNSMKMPSDVHSDLLIKVDPNQEPFREVFEGNEDSDRFTTVKRGSIKMAMGRTIDAETISRSS